jgi:hypothetical protein
MTFLSKSVKHWPYLNTKGPHLVHDHQFDKSTLFKWILKCSGVGVLQSRLLSYCAFSIAWYSKKHIFRKPEVFVLRCKEGEYVTSWVLSCSVRFSSD